MTDRLYLRDILQGMSITKLHIIYLADREVRRRDVDELE
jgi:hypothetical protein